MRRTPAAGLASASGVRTTIGAPTARAAATAAAASLTYSQAVLADSPVAYWRMSEPSGTSMADSAGSNTGTYQNSPTLGVTSPITSDASDKAITLAAASLHWITVPDANALDLGDVLTIEFWINRTNTTATQCVIDKGTGAYAIAFATTNFYFGSGSGSWVIQAFAGVASSTGTWYHIAVTKNGSTVKLYQNGVDLNPSTNALTLSDNATALRIGRDVSMGSGAWYLSASLDEMALYPTALSQARIQAHYNAR